MKGAILCQKGIEDLVVKEIYALIKSKAVAKSGYVVFEFSKVEDLFLLCYRSQLAVKVLLLLKEFTASTAQEVSAQVKGVQVPSVIELTETFAVRAQGEDAREIEREVGKVLDGRVDLEKPQLLYCVWQDEKQIVFGIDFSGEDLSKRDYRIFQTRQALKATTCKALFDLTGVTKGVVVNSYSGEGLIGIEAVCWLTGRSVHYYHKDKFQFRKMFERDWDKYFEKIDKKIAEKSPVAVFLYDDTFKHVDHAKKNAKIAGVHKLITFSRLAVEWIDTKFDKESVDAIICFPPQESKIIPLLKVKGIYKELFYQAKFALKPKGKLVVLMRLPGKLDEFAAMQGYKKIETREIQQGKNILYVETFGL